MIDKAAVLLYNYENQRIIYLLGGVKVSTGVMKPVKHAESA